MNSMLILVFLITLFNAAMLLLNYYFVNRNWEKLIAHTNEFRALSRELQNIERKVDRVKRKLDC